LIIVEAQIEIAAPAVFVWDVLVDFPRYPHWNPYIRSIEGLPDLGSKIQIKISPPGTKQHFYSPTILEYHPPSLMSWETRLASFKMAKVKRSFHIEKLDKNNTLFKQHLYGSGILMPLYRSFLQVNVFKGLEEMNLALKKVAEFRWNNRKKQVQE